MHAGWSNSSRTSFSCFSSSPSSPSSGTTAVRVHESRIMKQDRYAEMRRKKDEEREAQERRIEEEAMTRVLACTEEMVWKYEFKFSNRVMRVLMDQFYLKT